MSRTLLLQLGDLTLDLDDTDATGWVISEVDIGSPTVRESVTDLPEQDGQYDTTSYFGPRNVQITGTAVEFDTGDRGGAAALLAPFLAARVRPQLIYALDDTAELRVLGLRISQWSAPVSRPSSTDWSVQWVATSPIALGLTVNSVDIGPGSADPGRTYDRTYDRTYPSSTSADGIGLVDVGGDYPTWPVLRIFGPVTNPSIQWIDAVSAAPLGPAIVFSGLTIADGDYIEVSTQARTAYANGDPSANRFAFLDFLNTAFGPLEPGTTGLRFTGTGLSGSTLLQIHWQNAFLL